MKKAETAKMRNTRPPTTWTEEQNKEMNIDNQHRPRKTKYLHNSDDMTRMTNLKWRDGLSAPAIQFIHILICFHWHMARHQLCIIIIMGVVILARPLQRWCELRAKLDKSQNVWSFFSHSEAPMRLFQVEVQAKWPSWSPSDRACFWQWLVETLWVSRTMMRTKITGWRMLIRSLLNSWFERVDGAAIDINF